MRLYKRRYNRCIENPFWIIQNKYASYYEKNLSANLGIVIPQNSKVKEAWSLLRDRNNNVQCTTIPLPVPVVFDPASFYGHHEYELAIAKMFGGFSREFFSEYHNLIPKSPGYSQRLELYKLFHYLNHW